MRALPSLRLRLLIPLAPAALAAFALGQGAIGCSLSADVADVLQESDESTSGSTTSSTSSGSGSSSSGSSSTSSSGSSSGSSSTSSSGSTGAEDCTDGKDNDADGLTDCADTDCTAGFECVAAAPKGLGGIFRVDQAAIGMAAGCDGGGAPESYLADPAGPAECSACSCGDVAGATCSPPGLSCYPGSPACGIIGGQDWTADANAGACTKPTNLLGANNTLSCMLTSTTKLKEPGACPPSLSDFSNKASWGSEVVACPIKATGGGCDGGQVCVPKAPAGTAQSVCLKQDGAQACPGGWTQVISAFTSGTDTRGCSACQCGDPGTSCAGGGYTFYDLNGCQIQGASDPEVNITSNACANVSVLLDQGSWSIAPIPTTTTGKCAPSGGQATGELKTSGPVTFCCK